jgi:hypothetical protein
LRQLLNLSSRIDLKQGVDNVYIVLNISTKWLSKMWIVFKQAQFTSEFQEYILSVFCLIWLHIVFTKNRFSFYLPLETVIRKHKSFTEG